MTSHCSEDKDQHPKDGLQVSFWCVSVHLSLSHLAQPIHPFGHRTLAPAGLSATKPPSLIFAELTLTVRVRSPLLSFSGLYNKPLYYTLSGHLFSIMWLWVMSASPTGLKLLETMSAWASPESFQHFLQSGPSMSLVGRIREWLSPFPLPWISLRTALHGFIFGTPPSDYSCRLVTHLKIFIWEEWSGRDRSSFNFYKREPANALELHSLMLLDSLGPQKTGCKAVFRWLKWPKTFINFAPDFYPE